MKDVIRALQWKLLRAPHPLIWFCSFVVNVICMSIFLVNRETSAGGVVIWTTTGYCRRMQENHRNGQEQNDIVVTNGPYTRLRKKQLKIVFLISLTNLRWFNAFLNFFSYKAVFIVNVINVPKLISWIKFLPQSLFLSPMAKVFTNSYNVVYALLLLFFRW